MAFWRLRAILRSGWFWKEIGDVLGFPPPRMPVANEGLGCLLKYNRPGGDCYWAGGQPKRCWTWSF